MGARFRIRVGVEECVCQLLEDKAPNVCRIFRSALPLRSFAVHAKFAEEELIIMLPFWTEAENFRDEGNIQGDVSFYPNRQTLCLFYGHVTPFGKPGNVFARLVEGQEAMRRAAQIVLDRGSLPAMIYLEGAEEGETSFPTSQPETSLTPRVRSFLANVWAVEPPDVRALRDFKRPLMGNLPCVLYACFDLFWASENLQVCRDMARRRTLSLSDLNRMTAALLARTRSRLAHWDMKDTVALLDESVTYFSRGGPLTTEEYMSITQDLLLALDRVQSWIDAMIPWSKLDRSLSLYAPPDFASV